MSDTIANTQLISAIKNAWKYKYPYDKIDDALRNNADINWCSNEIGIDGQTPLLMAIDKYDNNEELYKDICKKLIKLKADVNKTSYEVLTPLMLAVECGASTIMELLLENGADINTQDKYGQTALLRAIRNRMDDQVKLLLEYGADVTIVDKYGKSAITQLKK